MILSAPVRSSEETFSFDFRSIKVGYQDHYIDMRNTVDTYPLPIDGIPFDLSIQTDGFMFLGKSNLVIFNNPCSWPFRRQSRKGFFDCSVYFDFGQDKSIMQLVHSKIVGMEIDGIAVVRTNFRFSRCFHLPSLGNQLEQISRRS